MDPTHHTKPTLVKKEEDVEVPHISSFPTLVGNDITISAEGHLSTEASTDGLVANTAPKPNKKEEAVIVPGTVHDTGNTIWQGILQVRGHRNDMVVPCVAIRYPTPHRPSVHDAAGWPSRLYCDSSKLKQCASVSQYMNEPISQGYVRFAPIHPNGNEYLDKKLVQLVKVMIQRELAFEIQCTETPSAMGTLYLWGIQLSDHGYSLLGVFRPGGISMAANLNMSNAITAAGNGPIRGATDRLQGSNPGISAAGGSSQNPVENGPRSTSQRAMPGVGVDPAITGGLNPVAGCPGAPLSNDQRIWQGNLRVRGHRNDMVVPCVAIRYPTPDRPSVHDAAGWPSQIYCDSSKLKQFADVFQYMNEPISQGYVRFAPIHSNGNEYLDKKLVQLVKVMIQRELAFEIQCTETPSAMGTLYLWGIQLPDHGYSLLGVCRPGPIPVENSGSRH